MTERSARNDAEFVAHHLRLFGIAASAGGNAVPDTNVCAVHSRTSARDAEPLLALAASGKIVVCLDPEADFCAALETEIRPIDRAPPAALRSLVAQTPARANLRTLHFMRALKCTRGTALVCNGEEPVWVLVPSGPGALLLLGTDLAGDLMRYRQGDPQLARTRPTEALWGIAGERPNYLFEPQLAGQDPFDRPADWWVMALVDAIAAHTGRNPEPILPGGAPGAIVVTGDDDQAYLEKYDEQLALLGDCPVTYFLHPLTRHTRKTLDGMRRGHRVDLGLHPDALDAPGKYPERLAQQAAWFRKLVGRPAASIRNHGFLNDGYWGHLPSWRSAGIRISSNIPGLDGKVMNGSLLPARVSCEGELSEHWSVLTAIGDGVRSVLGLSDLEAGDCVRAAAQRIRDSGVPGVLVLNLHPQNVAETMGMHHAAVEVLKSGFVGWTLREALDWFERRDAPTRETSRPGGLGSLLDRLRWWRTTVD